MRTNDPFGNITFGGDSAYESAVLACGRLDAVVSTAPSAARHLLLCRAALVATGSGGGDAPVHLSGVAGLAGLAARPRLPGMIALLRPDGEGESESALFRDALIAGAGRLQGGAMPTLSLLQSLLGEPLLRDPELIPLDAILRDADHAAPPLVKAMAAASALRHRGPGSAALAFSLIVRSAGVIAEGWLSIPRATLEQADGEASDWTASAHAALDYESRSIRQGLDVLRTQLAIDETRLRDELGRAAWSALDMLALLQREPVVAIPRAAKLLGQTVPTAGAAIARLESRGLATELTGRGRDRLWTYSPAVALLAPE